MHSLPPQKGKSQTAASSAFATRKKRKSVLAK